MFGLIVVATLFVRSCQVTWVWWYHYCWESINWCKWSCKFTHTIIEPLLAHVETCCQQGLHHTWSLPSAHIILNHYSLNHTTCLLLSTIHLATSWIQMRYYVWCSLVGLLCIYLLEAKECWTGLLDMSGTTCIGCDLRYHLFVATFLTRCFWSHGLNTQGSAMFHGRWDNAFSQIFLVHTYDTIERYQRSPQF